MFVVRCSMRDCVGRAEHGETRNGTEGEGAWGGLPGQAVCVLIDQHCCRIRLQRDGHIDWQSVSPGRNEACPPGKRFANANIVAPGSPSCCFSTDARGGGWETGRRGGGKKKIKKYRVERSTFSTPISPLLFFPLPFPSFQIFDVRKTIPISGSRETGLRTENPYVKFLGRGREGERSFPLHGRLLPTSSFDHHPPPPYPSMRSRDLRGSQGVVNAEERVTTQRRVAEKNIGRKFAGGKRFLGYESRES